jgi:hypothetical protein
VAAAPSPPHAKRPPAGFTGGFGEGTCAFCHIGNDVNAYDGYVRLEGLPETYEPGRAYVLTVELSAEETSVAGFELAARYADGSGRGADAGSVAPVDTRTAVSDSLGVSYIHQSEEGWTTDDPNGSRWAVQWSAPESGDPVAIHVAANSGNGDDSPLGDLIYTTDVMIHAAGNGVTTGSVTQRPPTGHRGATRQSPSRPDGLPRG